MVRLHGELAVMIPPAQAWWFTASLGLWVVVWLASIVGLTVLLFYALRDEKAPVLFLLVFLAMWIAAGWYPAHRLAWQVFGREIIEVTHETIVVGRKVLGSTSRKVYSADHIRGLRASSSNVAASHYMMLWSAWYPGLQPTGALAFDYGSRTIRFGGGIDEAEAKEIVSEIFSQFPEYGK